MGRTRKRGSSATTEAAGPQLRPDPKNARKHPEKNKALIRRSLEEVGAFRSIAVDGEGIIRAGNGVYEQASALGLKVRVVEAAPDELIAVKRPDLVGKKAVRAALLDNRAGETSEWDEAALADLAATDADVLAGLFDEGELKAQAEAAEVELKQLEAKPPPKMTWVLIGLPTVRFGEVAADVERLAGLPGVICETTANDYTGDQD